jgi:hypothetical protein
MERRLWSVERPEQFFFVGVEASEQAVEGGKAGPALEDLVEALLHLAFSARIWCGTVGLEVGVERPNEGANIVLGFAGDGGEGFEFVNQPFGMHPAQRVRADIELSGIVGQDDGILDEAVVHDGAPHGAFGGDCHRVEGALGCPNVERLEVGLPPPVIGEALLGVACQLGDGRGGQPALAHIGEGRLVEHKIGVAGAQEAEEIGPALRPGGGEEGEDIIADRRADAVFALVPGASIWRSSMPTAGSPNDRPPEADMRLHFQVTAPSVHQMVMTLEKAGLIKREPGKPRSIQLLVPPEALPILR